MAAEHIARYPRSTYCITTHGILDDGNGLTVVNLSNGQSRHFRSLWALVQWMEQDIDATDHPQRVFQYRTWGEAPPLQEFEEVGDIAPAQRTACRTFVVQVLYRQNATWQGTVKWVEGRKTMAFRSEHELLRLMDEATRSTETQGKYTPPWVTDINHNHRNTTHEHKD